MRWRNTYVTEESDGPDNPNGLIEYKLEWTSDSNFLYVLSVLANKKVNERGR